MSYLTGLVEQASGVPPAQALRPMPSFLRPAPASPQWAGELAVETDAGPSGVATLAAGPLSTSRRVASPEPPARPEAPGRATPAEMAHDRQPAVAAPERRAEPSGNPPAAEVASVIDGAPVLADAVAPAAVPEPVVVDRLRPDRRSPTRELVVPAAAHAVDAVASGGPVAPREIRVAPVATALAPAVDDGLGSVFEPEPSPVVTVHIDRVDVVAPRRPAASRSAVAAPRPAAPTMSLDAYLTGRSGR